MQKMVCSCRTHYIPKLQEPKNTLSRKAENNAFIITNAVCEQSVFVLKKKIKKMFSSLKGKAVSPTEYKNVSLK